MTKFPIRLNWYDDDKTIVLWKHQNKISWQDAYDARQNLWRMMESVSHTVDLIVDMNHHHMPAGAIPNLKRLIVTKHSRTGIIILLNAPSYFSALFEMVMRVMRVEGQTWHTATSLEDAENFIRRHRYAQK